MERTTPAINRRPTVEARTGLPKSSIYAKIALGEFPKPIRIGARAVGWLESDITAWIEQRAAESKAEASSWEVR